MSSAAPLARVSTGKKGKMRNELDRQAFVDEKSPSLSSGSTLPSRRRVVDIRRLSYRRMCFLFQADKGKRRNERRSQDGCRWIKEAIHVIPFRCPHSKSLQSRRALQESDHDHAGNTSQSELASLKSNTSALGALGNSSDGGARGGNSCRVESSRADSSADRLMAG